MPDYADVPAEVIEQLRQICGSLPETHEEQAWAGRRWCIRKRTFAHVLSIDSERGPATVLAFRASGDELDALRAMGHPFFRPGSGADRVGMVVDGEVDWDEVGELLTESYCLMAPQKLAATVPRPGEGQ